MIVRKQFIVILMCCIATTTALTNKIPSPTKRKLSIQTNCTRDLMEIKIDLGKKFRGLLFAKDFLDECRAKGTDRTISLKIPTAGCGVRSESKDDGSLEYTVEVMLQMDEKLRQSSDIKRNIKCTISPSMMNMNLLMISDHQKRTGRMHSITSNDPSVMASNEDNIEIPRARIWLELFGNNSETHNSGSVQVGEPATLAIKAILPGTIGVRVFDCSALDGLGDSSQELLDYKGCPWDEQVMPALLSTTRAIEEGWSKSHADDLVERRYEATFPAFKFPDRERLHVSCGVQLCRGACPSVNCSDGNNDGKISIETQLTRIEVFNSISVTAPQIDDLLNNEEYSEPQRVRDGKLCLSFSNLALVFCILGLIFLVAVIFSVICCMLRVKSRKTKKLSQNNESVQTISSSSESGQSTYFGSKLLFSYQGYGRVY